ncbi:MAG: redox-sensing transcriptional repressor Rex [Clostridia bacterium]|jgi:redox-sensing transcriptional repressor
MARNRVSEAVIRRLPKYYRFLQEMDKNGIERVSSQEMSRRLGLTASQIRQDFNCFGGFGQQGYGYNVSELRKEITRILGLGRVYNAIIVGAGNLGQALANYIGFEREGFQIKAVFDINPRLIGMSIRGIEVMDIDYMEEYIRENDIQMAILAVPKSKAQEMADKLVGYGIRGIWNFAPIDVEVGEDVSVENVHLSDSLYILSYRMKDKEEE